MQTDFNPLKTKHKLFYLRPSPYRAVNAFHLFLKTSHFMLYRVNFAVWSEVSTIHLLKCGQNVQFLNVNLNVFVYQVTSRLACLLSPWSRVLPEKLTGSLLVKKFPEFYGTRRSITAFTSPATCAYPELD